MNYIDKTGPRNYIFGYGSLINSNSRLNSSISCIQFPWVIPITVSKEWGYYRSWGVNCNCKKSGDKLNCIGLYNDNKINSEDITGVIFAVDNNGLCKFDKRECNYSRILIPKKYIKVLLSFSKLPKNIKIWTYISKNNEYNEISKDYPISQRYLDICLLGCLEWNEEFTIQFILSTYNWSNYWVNDRITYNNDDKLKIIDNILNEYVNCSRKYVN